MSLSRLARSVTALVLVLSLAVPLFAEETPTWSDPPFKEFAQKIDKLIKHQYPKADRGLDEKEQTLRWAYDTRKFMVHLPTLTGKWQEASELTGPNRGGILCDMRIHQGEYLGMAQVPQSFDRHYFTVLLMAPYREDADAHVTVRLYYPIDVDKGFLTQFAETVNQFDSER
ncbi:hypothetical protein GC197_17820 [bacterium]|nr:hypothetical protein [bacterium]